MFKFVYFEAKSKLTLIRQSRI